MMCLMAASFDSARGKIERADKHRRDIQSAIETFLCENPYLVLHKHDPQSRKLVYYVGKYTALAAASEGKLDSGGWHALMKDVLHLSESMLPAVKWALKQGAWRRANDPIRSIRENAEREAGRMGLSEKAAVPKGK